MKKFLIPVQVLLASLPFSSANAALSVPEVPATDLQKVKFVKPSLLKMVPTIDGNVPSVQYAQHRTLPMALTGLTLLIIPEDNLAWPGISSFYPKSTKQRTFKERFIRSRISIRARSR